MPAKVLLTALIGSDNLGDEAINEVLVRLIEEHPDRPALTVLTRDVGRTSGYFGSATSRALPHGVRATVSAIRSTDVLLVGGGGIINDESSVLSLLKYFAHIVLGRLFRRRVVLLWVGVGPVSSRAGRWVLRRMASMVEHSVVRDVESRDLLLESGFRAESVQAGYDIVFSMTTESARDQADGSVLFCPRDWFFLSSSLPTKVALRRALDSPDSDLHTYRDALLETCRRILDARPDRRLVGVPFYYSQDAPLLHALEAELASTHPGRFSVTQELTPREFIDRAARSEAVVGVRLHSLVIGAAAGCPIVPIVYTSKVRSMVSQLELTDVAVELDRPRFDIDAVVDSLGRVEFDDVRQADVDELVRGMRARNDEIWSGISFGS